MARSESPLELTELRLADTQDQVADLRHRLDQADTDRRQALDRLAAAQERIAALLTDQRSMHRPLPFSQPAPPALRRSWWRWGRQSGAAPSRLVILPAEFAMLEVACSRCERRGRLRVDRLIEQHGDAELPDLRLILPGDCPKAGAASIGAQRSVYYSQLLPPGRVGAPLIHSSR